MSVRWYLPSCHLHLEKKIWRGKKHKVPSRRLQQKIKMKRKEMQRTVLQVLRYIFKKKDGVKRNLQDHLAGDDVSLKMQLTLQGRKYVNLDGLIEISTITN